MFTRKAVFLLLFTLIMGLTIHAQPEGTIVFISRPYDTDPETGEPPDMPHVYALQEAGYDVVIFYNEALSTASQETLDTLYNANLIIMGRSSPSLPYQFNKLIWNAITTPILNLELWNCRNTRLNWFDTSDMVTVFEEDIYNAIIEVPDDPVFDGLDISSPVPWMIAPYDAVGTSDAGNGNVLARSELDSTVLFVRFKPNVEFYDGAGDMPAGHRTVIGNGRDESGGPPFHYYNFTRESERVFMREVARLFALGGGTPPASDVARIYQFRSAPTIDAVEDDTYGSMRNPIAVVNEGEAYPAATDLSGYFKSGWIGNSLYLFFNITDDIHRNGAPNPWEDDGVEIYFDGDNSKTESSYDDQDDLQLRIEADDVMGGEGEDEMEPRENALYDLASCEYKTLLKEDGTGYYIECCFNIDGLRLTGDENGYFGFDVQINDGENDTRENMLRWHANSNDAWHWAHLFGYAILLDDYITPSHIDLTNTINFPVKSKGSDYKATDYRIMGLPGESRMLIGGLFSGIQGKDWQVYWDNGTEDDFLVEYNGSDMFQCVPGRAFWILNKGTLQINQQNAISTQLNSYNEAVIEVHPRWNLITNPFSQPIEWAKAQELNQITNPIWSYPGSWDDQNQILEPYVGYYLDNNTDPPLTALRIPFDPVTGSLSKPVTTDPYEWKVGISLQNNEITDKCCFLAVKEGAKQGQDSNEYCKPRATGSIPEVYFYRPGWDKSYPSFANDVRPLFKEKIEEWDFQVQTPSLFPSTLSFSGLEDIPAQFAVFLINNSNTACINLREQDSYDFTPQAEVSSFTVLVGKEQLVKERLEKVLPLDFSLSQNFPNPFNPVTTIPFALPSQSHITIKVYNITGQKVKTLVNGTMDGGRHQVSWDGKDERGIKVSSGLYIYRMITAGGKNFSGKMLLLK
jgi:hypothetical protein